MSAKINGKPTAFEVGQQSSIGATLDIVEHGVERMLRDAEQQQRPGLDHLRMTREQVERAGGVFPRKLVAPKPAETPPPGGREISHATLCKWAEWRAGGMRLVDIARAENRQPSVVRNALVKHSIRQRRQTS